MADLRLITRRGFLSAVPPALMATGAVAVPASAGDDAIAEAAAHLANLMRQKHGGDWRVSIDNKAEFVLIVRDY